MSFIFNEFLYRPLLNLLFLIYNFIVADLGIAIILLTIIIRLILLPLFYKGARDQTIIQKITPQIRELQKIHKEDKEKQVKEILKVYKEHKVSPFTGFLLLLIQIPILIALYKVFSNGFSENVLSNLYSFITVSSPVNSTFLGIVDLNLKNTYIAVLAGVLQYLQTKLMMMVSKQKNQKENQAVLDKADKMADLANQMSKNLMVMGPLLTVAVLYSLPSAVGLYWLTTSVFSVIQQIIINKKIAKNEQ